MIDDSLRRNVRHAACPVVCGARFRVRNERIGLPAIQYTAIQRHQLTPHAYADDTQDLRVLSARRFCSTL